MTRAHDEAMLELAALRAIGALEADEAAMIDEHMRECADCRAEFARSRAAGSALAFSASSPAPASLRERVLLSAIRIRRIRPWFQHPALPAGLAAAVVLVVAGSWFMLHRIIPTDRGALQCVAQVPACGGQVSEVGGIVHLDAHGLPAPPQGKVYQAWVIHGSEAPIPEPTFAVSANGDGTVAMQAEPAKGDIIAITVEPEGGSKAPTSKPVGTATMN